MMDEEQVCMLLQQVSSGACEVNDALKRLKSLSNEEMGFACLDHQRQLRTGLPEVIYGEGKTAEQIVAIISSMQARGSERILATRISGDKAALIMERCPGLRYHDEARILTLVVPKKSRGRGTILVVAAGTSDVPVAREAAVTAEYLGNEVETIIDVGVAGLHRLLEKKGQIDAASVLIVVAGMEGALPSVIGGLVDKPVIAVPTSVGYGTGFGGIAALLGMLNSCAPGVAVVNIDNGFGAGCVASAINRH
jgi:NCAIR mutase (PurE)-related protein